jgi:hypothetical protein
MDLYTPYILYIHQRKFNSTPLSNLTSVNLVHDSPTIEIPLPLIPFFRLKTFNISLSPLLLVRLTPFNLKMICSISHRLSRLTSSPTCDARGYLSGSMGSRRNRRCMKSEVVVSWGRQSSSSPVSPPPLPATFRGLRQPRSPCWADYPR